MEQPPAGTPIEIGLNEREAEGIYSNLVFIAHSPSEVILDFARTMPGLQKPRVFARIIMTPPHAKSLLGALEQNLGNYEKQFGTIPVLGTLPGTRTNPTTWGSRASASSRTRAVARRPRAARDRGSPPAPPAAAPASRRA